MEARKSADDGPEMVTASEIASLFPLIKHQLGVRPHDFVVYSPKRGRPTSKQRRQLLPIPRRRLAIPVAGRSELNERASFVWIALLDPNKRTSPRNLGV